MVKNGMSKGILFSLFLLGFFAVGITSASLTTISVDSVDGFLQTAGKWSRNYYNDTWQETSVMTNVASAAALEGRLKANQTDMIITACGATRGPGYVNIPVGGSAVAIFTYIPNLPSGFRVNLTPNQLAGIFSGRITKWGGVAENNPLLINNDLLIKPQVVAGAQVIHYAFTEFLATASSDWKSGASYTPSYGPQVRTAATERDLINELLDFPGSIGYASMPPTFGAYIQVVQVQALDGDYLGPGTTTAYFGTARIDFPTKTNSWLGYIPRPHGKTSYPIPLLYCYVVPVDLRAQGSKGCVTVDFLRFITNPEQQYQSLQFFFLPLPANIIASATANIDLISTSCPPAVEYCTEPKKTRIEYIEVPKSATNIQFKFGNMVRKRTNSLASSCNNLA